MTHYDLRVLLEAEGVGPEINLLPRTEEDLVAELCIVRNNNANTYGHDDDEDDVILEGHADEEDGIEATLD